jgi:acetyl esterase/lipase
MGNCQTLNKVTVVIADDCGSGSGGRQALDVKVTESFIPSSIENDNFQIPIKTFTPTPNTTSSSTTTPRAVVFFIHGGIFALGDMHSHPTISNALSSQLGLVVITASFRNGEEAPHASNVTMTDLNDVVNYCIRTYPDLPFGLVGSSSGGFFAIHLSQTLQQQPSKKKEVAFCIPICPVADPFKRASYLRSSISGSAQSEGYNAVHTPEKSKFILEKQLSFWQNDESMLEASASTKSNTRNVPTLLIIGSADKNVPFVVTNEVQGWATRTIVIGGRGHELCDEVVGGYCCYLPDVERFLEYCLREEK